MSSPSSSEVTASSNPFEQAFLLFKEQYARDTLETKETIARLSEDVSELSDRLSREVGVLSGDVSKLSERLTREVGGLSGDVSKLSGDVSQLSDRLTREVGELSDRVGEQKAISAQIMGMLHTLVDSINSLHAGSRYDKHPSSIYDMKETHG